MENPAKHVEELIEIAREVIHPLTEEQKKVFLDLFKKISEPSRYEEWIKEKREELEEILNKH